MAAIDVTQKADVYETLSSLNLAFAGILQSSSSSWCRLSRNSWTRYGKVRQRWEKEIRDPDDVLLQAEERKRELAKQRKKR